MNCRLIPVSRATLGGLLLWSAAARAAAPDSETFAWRQPIGGTPEIHQLYRVRMTPETWDGLCVGPEHDLRVTDATGERWPFFIWREPGTPGTVDLSAERLNDGTEIAGVRQFDLRIDAAGARAGHDRIRIEFNEPEYMRRVEVLGRETDEDAWTRLGSGFLVRIPRSPEIREDVIPYASSTYRHLRIRIHPDLRSAGDLVPSPVAAPGRTGGVPAPVETQNMDPLDLPEPEPADARTPRAQRVGFDAGAQLPFEHIELRAQGAYARDVTIWSRAAVTSEWAYAGQGRISRHSDAEYARIPVRSGRARYWKMEIRQGDDEPLKDVQATGFYPRTWIVFEARTAEPAAVQFGSERHAAPLYDLAARTPRPGVAAVLTLGPREANPGHRPAFRPPAWIVPAGVGLAALVVLAIIFSRFKEFWNPPAAPRS
ncbi:MAG: hypothetical protein KBA51_03420 [Kiritimatiellae bacterium]|nr:hypothetical protein [Kiritimatiellia bacterium]